MAKLLANDHLRELFNSRAPGICNTLRDITGSRLPLEIRSMFCPERTMPPDDPWHFHLYSEIRYLMDGNAVWDIPGQSIATAAGDIILIPASVFHRRHHTDEMAQAIGFRLYLPNQEQNQNGWPPLKCDKYTLTRSLQRDIAEMIRLGCSRQSTGELQAAFLLGRVFAGMMEQCLPSLLATPEHTPETSRQGSWEFRTQVYHAALQYIEDNLHRSLSVEEIAGYCHVSTRHLSRIFWQLCGVPPGQKIIRSRIARAFVLLSEPERSIREIAGLLGFADVPHFNRAFHQATKLTPGEYRKSLPEPGAGHFTDHKISIIKGNQS